MGSFELAITLSFLAGAAHVLAPDHWMPGSVVAWQRGWGFIKTSLFSLGIFYYMSFLAF